MTGFGTAPLDYDGDGVLDLFVANGAVRRIESQVEGGDPHPLRMENQLFRGLGGGRFETVPAAEREHPVLSEVSRGLAVGDLDNDGDPDLVITNNGGRARVLLNRRPPGGAWLGLRLVASIDAADASANRVGENDRTPARSRVAPGATREPVREPVIGRTDGRSAHPVEGSGLPILDMYGARARIAGQGGWQWTRTDGSYAAASDPRLLFSLTAGAAPATVEVVWPDGALEVFVRLTPNRYHVLRRGAGTAVETR